MMDNFDERLSLRIAIGGCISSGKSTLLNAICATTYSDMQRKRTTMKPQIYCETKNELDPIYIAGIREHNKIDNSEIYKKGSELTIDDIKPSIFPIPRIPDFMNLNEECYLDIYDLPGLNDSQTQDVFFQYIDQSHLDFDMIVYIVDVCSALNTNDEMNILTKFLDVIKKAKTPKISISYQSLDRTKKPISAYNFYVKSVYAEIKKEIATPSPVASRTRTQFSSHREVRSKDIICLAGSRWSSMNPEEKRVWELKYIAHLETDDPHNDGKTSRYPPPIQSKQIKFLVVLNKIDEISMLDSNGDAELDEEGQELVDQAREYITKEVKKRQLDEQYLGATYLCAADAYIYRLYNQNPNVKLDINHVNRFGINEYGKRSWSRFTSQQKEQKVRYLMQDESGSNYDERMTACGFTKLKQIINDSFSESHQVNLLLHRLSRHIHKNIKYIEGPREDLDNDIIKWRHIFKALHKVDIIYKGPREHRSFADVVGRRVRGELIQRFITSYFTPYINNIKDIYCSVLDPKIWTEGVYESQSKYRDNLVIIDNMLNSFNYNSMATSLITNVNENINVYLEWTARSSKSYEELFNKLDILVNNHYEGITVLTKDILFGPAGKITHFGKGFATMNDIINIISHKYLQFSANEQLETLKQYVINYLDYIITSDFEDSINIDRRITITDQRYLYALRSFTKHNRLAIINPEFNDLIENLTMNAIYKIHTYDIFLTSKQLMELHELPEMSIINHLLKLNKRLSKIETESPIQLEKEYSAFYSNNRDTVSGERRTSKPSNTATCNIINMIERKITDKKSFRSTNYNNI